MATLAWTLFGLALLWHFASQRLNHRRRIHLEAYVLYLLLADDIRARHKDDFLRWLREVQAPNALALSHQAHAAVDRMAEGLAQGTPGQPATSSILGTHALLWNLKKTL